MARMLLLLVLLSCVVGCANSRAALVVTTTIEDVDCSFVWETGVPPDHVR